MQAEFAAILSGGSASQFRDIESKQPVAKDEQVLGVVKGRTALELRKLVARISDFLEDYKVAYSIETPEGLYKLRLSQNLDVFDTICPLMTLFSAIIEMQWVEVYKEFPAHYHDGCSLGIRDGLKLIKVRDLQDELARPSVTTADDLPSGYRKSVVR